MVHVGWPRDGSEVVSEAHEISLSITEEQHTSQARQLERMRFFLL
jgi:hypothetical protein